MNAKHLFLSMCIAAASTAYGTPKHTQPIGGNTLAFVENKGQVTDQFHRSRTDIDFKVSGNGVNLFVGDAVLHYHWAKPAGTKIVAGDTLPQFTTYRMDVQLVGANPQAQVVKERKQNFYERYYISSFEEQGAIAYSYQKVTYKNVYPDIDWVLYVKNNTVEYDFVVRPGGKVADIKLQYTGATDVQIGEDGSLTATTPFGAVNEAAPFSFQQADGKPVASRFVLKDNMLSFSTNSYTGTLVIDPTLHWSTYYGGGLDDYSQYGNLTGDASGNVYLSGYTQGIGNIATTGSHQVTLAGGDDGFIAKFNSSGIRLWATYYGGTATDVITGAVCNGNNLFISGYSNSTSGIATAGSYQPTRAGSTDAFIARFDSSGIRQWSSYFGGTSTDQAAAICIDKVGNLYLTGYTSSTNGIATTGCHQATRGGSSDVFIAKFSGSGSRIWSTYYGGSSGDEGMAIATDTTCNIYLTGVTRSSSAIATTGAYQTIHGGGNDVFVSRFDSAGVRQWGTYLGGSGDEWGYTIAVDPSGNVYLGGLTQSTSGITTAGSYQTTFGGIEDGYIAKFSNAGSIVWASYYGGSLSDAIACVKLDNAGSIYVSGATNSANMATAGTFKDTISGLTDGLLLKLDTSGTKIWSTYFGGNNGDFIQGLYLTPLSELYMNGLTGSLTGMATAGSHQAIHGGGTVDAFLAKFGVCDLIAPTAITGANTVCPASTHSYSVPAVAGAVSYTWIVPTGWSGSSATNTISIQVGTTTDTLKVIANYLCGTSDTTTQIITVYPMPVITPAGTMAICAGDSITLTASSGTNYQWLQSGTVITGATNPSITVSSAGSYTVVVTSANGCTDTSQLTTVIVNPLPVPIITVNGSVLGTTLAYSSYQWNHSGSPITGATNATYTISLNTGNYSVTVTDSNGCSGTSDPYSPALGVHSVNGETYIVKLYPNPVGHTLFIEAKEQVAISIRSMDGRKIADYAPATAIDISMLPDGVYLLYMTDKKGLFIGTEKLIKQQP